MYAVRSKVKEYAKQEYRTAGLRALPCIEMAGQLKLTRPILLKKKMSVSPPNIVPLAIRQQAGLSEEPRVNLRRP